MIVLKLGIGHMALTNASRKSVPSLEYSIHCTLTSSLLSVEHTVHTLSANDSASYNVSFLS